MPALYSLALRGLLPQRFGIVGVSRTEMTVDEFREEVLRLSDGPGTPTDAKIFSDLERTKVAVTVALNGQRIMATNDAVRFLDSNASLLVLLLAATINRTFSDLYASVYGRTDLVVSGSGEDSTPAR